MLHLNAPEGEKQTTSRSWVKDNDWTDGECVTTEWLSDDPIAFAVNKTSF